MDGCEILRWRSFREVPTLTGKRGNSKELYKIPELSLCYDISETQRTSNECKRKEKKRIEYRDLYHELFTENFFFLLVEKVRSVFRHYLLFVCFSFTPHYLVLGTSV